MKAWFRRRGRGIAWIPQTEEGWLVCLAFIAAAVWVSYTFFFDNLIAYFVLLALLLIGYGFVAEERSDPI